MVSPKENLLYHPDDKFGCSLLMEKQKIEWFYELLSKKILVNHYGKSFIL